MYRRNGYASILDFDPKNGDGVMHLMRKILDPAPYEVYIMEHPEDLASIHDIDPARFLRAGLLISKGLKSFRAFK